MLGNQILNNLQMFHAVIISLVFKILSEKKLQEEACLKKKKYLKH